MLPNHERDEIINKAKSLARERGANYFTRDALCREIEVSGDIIRRLFGGYYEFCLAAGLDAGRVNRKLDESDIYEALYRTFIECRGIVSRNRALNHSGHLWPLKNNRRDWSDTLAGFLVWVQRHKSDFPYLEDLKAQVGTEKELPVGFLACSKEALPVAELVRNALGDTAIVEIWNEAFVSPGTYVLENLISKADKYDFAIALFASDDIVEIRGKRSLAARDNTVFEAGFFFGRLGRKRTFIMVPELPNLHLPSDFNGLTYVPYNANPPPDFQQPVISQACHRIKTSINSKSKKKRK